jgi:hypothetical protein
VLSAAKNMLAWARLPRSAILALTLFSLFVLSSSSSALAEPFALPPYDGGMTFAQISGPTEPEEYSWEVQLHDEQELEQIDERHAEVYEEVDMVRHPAFGIYAQSAHDAVGSSVPTTLAVSGTNVVTLTVHHRAGNPAAGGAPFVYPITQGPGWEGGFQTHYVQMPDAEPLPEELASEPAPACVVPGLKGRSLVTDRLRVRRAGCTLGKVRGRRSRTAVVVKQDLPPGSVLPAGARVGVALGDRRR